MDTDLYKKILENIKYRCTRQKYRSYIDEFIELGMKNKLITEENLPNVILKLEKIKRFAELPPNEWRRFVEIKKNPEGDGLTLLISTAAKVDERQKKQYVFREMARVIIMGEVELFVSAMSKIYGTNLSPKDRTKLYQGFLAFSESIAQEISEMLIYSSENTKRPKMQICHDPAIPGVSFKSNHEFLKLYQPIIMEFARTLEYKGDKKSKKIGQNEYVESLCQRAFSDNFAHDIISEYLKDNNLSILLSSFISLSDVLIVHQSFLNRTNATLSVPNSAVSYKRVRSNFKELGDQKTKKKERD